MNYLIAECIRRKSIEPVSKLNKNILSPKEIECRDWVLQYYRLYKETPPFSDLIEKFPDSAYFSEIEGSLDAIFDRFLRERNQMAMARLVDSMAMSLSNGEQISKHQIMELTNYTGDRDKPVESSKHIKDKWFHRSESGIPFSIPLFDGATDGMRDGDYTLIVGRPGSYKTGLCVWMAAQWFWLGKRIFLVSKEMTYADIFGRITSVIGRYNSFSMRKFDIMPRHEYLAYQVAKHILASSIGEIEIPRRSVETPDDLRDYAEFDDYDAIIVDGAYLLRTTSSKAGTTAPKWEQVAAVSNGLKALALDLGKPVIGVVQLKRGSDAKTRLTVDDIAYTDSLGQDADFVVSMKQVEKGTYESQLVKNRYGVDGIGLHLYVDFNTSKVAFGDEIDYDGEDDEPK